MHEYTLDEEELKRCQAVQDYYALYKVFKKSGPGPKNGEQYGAPFKEEEWADDEHSNFNDFGLLENSVKQVKAVASVDNVRANCQVQSPLNDLEEFMNRIADDEPLLVQPLAVDHAYTLQHLVGEEETQSTLVDPSLKETNLPEQSIVLHPSSQQYDVQASFDLTQSATSKLQSYEVPEVTSAPNICEQQPHVPEEDFLNDFIEMDDLIGPEPTIQNIGNPVENLQFEEIDGLSEFDLYHDAAMFLCDMGPVDPSSVSRPCLDNLENEVVNPVSHSYLNNLENGAVNQVSHLYLNNLGNDMGSLLDCQLQPCSNDANWNSSQLWMHDQESSVFATAESDQGTIPQPSGVVYAGNSANPPTGGNQNQSSEGDDGTESWFSSALWAFVESIPTTPASASESALVNRAFERMSSFSRVRINSGNTHAIAGNPTATVRRSCKYNRGFFCFSVLGMVCAILCWLIGTSVKVLGRFISS
uniref:NAC domain-containing protein n=1 Tax=Davidia involucrata TaxID=16924 RepID=A0A5B7AW54_DAVIN